MIINPKILKIYLFFTACLFLKGLLLSSMAMASNEVYSINASEGRDKVRVMLFLNDRPSYSLYAVSEGHLMLTLHDTLKGEIFEKNIPGGDTFAINEDQNPIAVRFDINLQSQFLKVDSSWLEDKKLLCIEILFSEKQAAAEPAQNKTTLRDISFGSIDKGTEMVMKLDNNPSWKIEFSSPSELLIHLVGTSDALKKRKYGPVKRLKKVNVLKANDKGTDIYLALEAPLTHVSISSKAAEDGLALDILDDAGVISEELSAHDNNISPDTVVLKEEGTSQEKKVIEDKGNYLRVKIDKDESPVLASSTGDMTSDKSEIKTGNIPSGELKNDKEDVQEVLPEDKTENIQSGDAESEIDRPETSEGDADVPVNVKPKFDYTLPMSSEVKKKIDGLNPEEAFLYGRIKQAMEIKDYEKGIELINQFLNELPGSTLIEDLIFMRGDFYYYLWKIGDDEVAENIVPSYQKAIDRFPDSGMAPPAYIKMAQVQALEGKEYLALGYLGMVLSQKKNNDLMPFAHLTRGKIFMRINEPEKALADFNAILDRYKRSGYAGEANFWIGNYYHAVGKYAEAEKTLEEVLDSDPEIYLRYPEYFFLRAKNYLCLKDYDHAREYLFKAVNIGQQQESTDMLLTRIGDTYHNQENESEAKKFYRMVIDYYPDTEGASIAKLRVGVYSSDMRILDDLSKLKTNESVSEAALLEKGYQFYDKNQYANAVDTIKPLIDKSVQTETRKSAKRLFDIAAEKELVRLYKEGKYKDMTDFYISVNDNLPDNIKSDTMLSVALAFNKLQLGDQAILAFQAVKTDNLGLRSRGAYYLGLAESYFNSGYKQDARSLLEKAKNHDLDPADKQRVFKSIALLYSQDNMLNDAYLLCRSVINGEKLLAEDEITDTYILTARILNLQKKYTEAEVMINSIPGMPDRIKSDLLKSAYVELGKAYYNMGDYPSAVKSYEKTFDLGYGTDDKDYWPMRFNLAKSYLNTGEEDRARRLFSEIEEGADTILQQRAEIQLGTMDLEIQLQKLSLDR